MIFSMVIIRIAMKLIGTIKPTTPCGILKAGDGQPIEDMQRRNP